MLFDLSLFREVKTLTLAFFADEPRSVLPLWQFCWGRPDDLMEPLYDFLVKVGIKRVGDLCPLPFLVFNGGLGGELKPATRRGENSGFDLCNFL